MRASVGAFGVASCTRGERVARDRGLVNPVRDNINSTSANGGELSGVCAIAPPNAQLAVFTVSQEAQLRVRVLSALDQALQPLVSSFLALRVAPEEGEGGRIHGTLGSSPP